MPEDARREVLDGRFDYRVLKGRRVTVSHDGRPVTTLAGKDAGRFLKRAGGLEDHAARAAGGARDREFRAGQRALSRGPCRLSPSRLRSFLASSESTGALSRLPFRLFCKKCPRMQPI
ncbi:hypothetical protein DESA109040_06945 [Deinococcus saxicola]|uniref:hypothetical protein n=1 Tax=Deinococcus saxicola TaxID=249406 RepID=UPI0039EFCEA9